MSGEDQDNGVTDKLLSDKDEAITTENDSSRDDNESVENILKDLQEETELLDDDDDEESVEDLLKALVADEEDKLKKVFKKRKGSGSSAGTSSRKHVSTGDVVLIDEDGESISPLKSNLQLNISAISDRGNKPTTATVLERQKRAQELLKKHVSQRGKICCGLFCMVFILAIGCGLVFAAYWFSLKDLYIIGGVFAIGGVIFSIGFVIVRCTEKSDPDMYSVLYKSSPSDTF